MNSIHKKAKSCYMVPGLPGGTMILKRDTRYTLLSFGEKVDVKKMN